MALTHKKVTVKEDLDVNVPQKKHYHLMLRTVEQNRKINPIPYKKFEFNFKEFKKWCQ